MGWIDRFRRKSAPSRTVAPNPFTNPNVRGAGFTSGDIDRLLNGWDTSSNTIDFYLRSELRQIRARSRAMVRQTPYGKRFISALKSNVVGPNGVRVQAQTMIYRQGLGSVLDTGANDALEAAFKDWGEKHCDFLGKSTWVDLQNLAISCAGQDGEFLFEEIIGKRAGKYHYQLRAIDPELLNTEKNTDTKNGVIRLGVEYDKLGRVIRYHFIERDRGAHTSGYRAGREYTIPATQIIHGFIPEWPDQSRGVPWMRSSIETAKHLEKYDEAAIVNARAGASTMAVLHGDEPEGYQGDEDGTGEYEGATLDHYEAGTIKDIGNRSVTQLDPVYPHQMYGEFTKEFSRRVAVGLDLSYHTLTGNLEGVNYSSIRAGVLDDRDLFKGVQNWFIRALIQRVYETWIDHAFMSGQVKVGGVAPLRRKPSEYYPASYQGRRWDWVDPQKDGNANDLAIKNRTKSISQVIRDAGGDPESVFREIQRERQMMEEMGITPEEVLPQPEAPPDA